MAAIPVDESGDNVSHKAPIYVSNALPHVIFRFELAGWMPVWSDCRWIIVFKSCLAEKNVTKLQMPACVKLLSSALSQTTNEADSAANLPLLLSYEADRAAIL